MSLLFVLSSECSNLLKTFNKALTVYNVFNNFNQTLITKIEIK